MAMVCSTDMKKEQGRAGVIVFSVLFIFVVGLFYQQYSCLPTPKQAPKASTHGFEVWSNGSFKSFMPGNKRFCVPKDWEPVGEVSLDKGGAIFPEGSTGILIKSSDFSSIEIPLNTTDFELTALYLKDMPESEVQTYAEIIARAFNDVGSLYPDSMAEPQKHTVFITVGIAGDGNAFEASLYPNPSQYISVFAKNRHHSRAEELFIHGATHAYNRFLPHFQTYQNNQSPIPPGDFEEMEATWAELTFRSSREDLVTRVDNLYRTYEAVMSKNYDAGALYPFNNRRVFEGTLRTSVNVPENATEGEVEFGHYILAPLVMLTIEGMLQEQQSTMDLNSILLEVHSSNSNFFELLSTQLSADQTSQVQSFIEGRAIIPEELILRGLAEL